MTIHMISIVCSTCYIVVSICVCLCVFVNKNSTKASSNQLKPNITEFILKYKET